MRISRLAMPLVAFILMAVMMPMPVEAAATEYAYTPVKVNVLTDRSFTVTLNGQAATNSDPAHPGTATETLWFNATDGNIKSVNASVIGSSTQVGPWPACTTPIMEIKNLGTTTMAINMKLNNTLTSVKFDVNASMKTGSTTGTPLGIGELTTTGLNLVTGLGINNITSVCTWCNLTGTAAGEQLTWFNYTSS